MCSVVILRRPDHSWPIVMGANRDEMRDRPWQPPARHWPDRPEVRAGLDELAGGTWMGVNDTGLAAAVLNRVNSLGPAPDKRSRGELVLEALDHADAADAVEALTHLEPDAYRPFNMVIADNRDAFWLKNDGTAISAHPVPVGVSMITAHDLNDTASDARIAHHLPRFRAAPAPDPEGGDWSAWEALLASHDVAPEGRATSAMCFALESGFGTVSSCVLALPAIDRDEVRPVWRFAAGAPDSTPFEPVAD